MSTLEAPPLDRKLVAIMAADIEGYSRLMHENEERTLAALSHLRSITDELITASRGNIAGTAGDSVLAEFASVVDAVNCAIAVQEAIINANQEVPKEQRLLFRIGINVGDVMVKDGTIFGDGVNVASRVEALAEPGGICVTRGVRDHLRDRPGYAFEDLGEHSVKNISRPVRVFRVVPEDAKSDATDPPDEVSMIPDDVAGLPSNSDSEAIELAFWQSVSDGNKAEEYGAYLERYPLGAFAALAKSRLAASETAEEVPDRETELTYWNSVKDAASAEMFEAYLQKYPNGEFRALAEIKLAELKQ